MVQLSTIRVCVGDTFTQYYTLVSPSGVAVNLTSATPEVDVINVDTGEVVTTIECAVVAPTTTGVVSFSVEDATGVAGMYTLRFRVINVAGLVTTYPVNGIEQGLLVT